MAETPPEARAYPIARWHVHPVARWHIYCPHCHAEIGLFGWSTESLCKEWCADHMRRKHPHLGVADSGRQDTALTGSEASSWSDLDRALFWLDGACQSIVDEFHAPVWPEAIILLDQYRDRITQLRRDYAVSHPGRHLSSREGG